MPIPLGILAVAGAGGGGASAFDLLETTLISTNTASVTFSNLNTYSDYKHLQIRATQRVTGASLLWNNQMYFNNDQTSGRYANHELGGNGSSAFSAAYTTSQTNLRLPSVVGADASSSIFNASIVDILDFSNTNKNTTIRALGGSHFGTGGRIFLLSGVYLQTSAITSITFLQADGQSFVSGTRISLYGIK